MAETFDLDPRNPIYDKRVPCTECGGTGHTGVSNCCTATIYEDTDICSDCKEHADDECSMCEGSGLTDPITEKYDLTELKEEPKTEELLT